MTQIGTPDNPLRIAIIGSGPSGFYAADHLQKQSLTVEIDMFDRLPTPFGLVRGGVAPDHQKIKSVTKLYERIAAKPEFRFFGHVEFGTDITRADLQKLYHAVIYAVGSASDKKLGIPGEDLPGSYAATEFVGWYNGHPDYRHYEFDLSAKRVVVIGVGNVAMDVARILARTPEELAATDIADYAAEALANSAIEEIVVVGRRGPAQASFTNPEIQELGEMAGADIIVDPADMELDEPSKAYLTSDKVDKKDVRNVEILRDYAARTPTGKPKRIVMRFMESPVELHGDDAVTGITLVKNELYTDDRGNVRPRATDQTIKLSAELVFRSVGYRGVALKDVPFYDRWGTIPNDKGRVMTDQSDGEQVIGDYVSGWIKRGPSGIIGTNKPDSVETVNMLLEDVAAGKTWAPDATGDDATVNLLNERGIDYVTFADWLILDQIEQERGAVIGRPRVKFTTIEDMLSALRERKSAPNPAGD